MTTVNRPQFLPRDRKSAFRLLLDLYATNSTFRGFTDFTVIGATALLFIHGFQALSIGNIGQIIAPPKLTDQDLKTQADIANFGLRNSTLTPQLSELGLDEKYFADDREPQRTALTEAWRAYRGKDPRKAVELLQSLGSDDPHVLLVRGLATMAQPQNGALRSGALYIEAAAAKGDPKSMAVLGVLNLIGTPGLQADLEKGQKLILDAAAKGDIEASRVAGKGYLSGWMGSIDPGRAAKYFRFAADRNDRRAALLLADLYFNGRGVTKDNLEGDRLVEKSASQGDREAQTLMGLRRMQTYVAGVTGDPSDALYWLERAAEQNDPSALQSLAMYHINFAARSARVDIPKGVALLKRCVDQTGDSTCAMSYAGILDNGLDRGDTKTVYTMYLLANRDGRNEAARTRMAELAKKLSTQDLIQIQMDVAKHPLEPLAN